MDIEGVVIFDAKSGIPLFSRVSKGIDSSLFSSFISAIVHFAKDMELGGLTSFTTEAKMIFLAPRENTITALITPTRKEFQEAASLAGELGKQFEDKYHMPDILQPQNYKEFQTTAEEFLRKVKNPFVSNVATFVHSKYGGSVAIKPRLMKENGNEGTVDMLVNLGVRYDDEEDSQKNGKKTQDIYSESYIFCKLSEGRMSRGEVIEFIDSLDGYGIRAMKKDSMEFIPYFPTRAIIIAREYAEPVFDFLRKLPREEERICVDGAHVFAGRKMNGGPKNAKCYVDVYKWHENSDPEAINFSGATLN
jgi:hypothetical protein